MKRMTAVLLALALAVCLLPAGAIAAGEELWVARAKLESGKGYLLDYDAVGDTVFTETTGSPHLAVEYDSAEDTWILIFNAPGMNITGGNRGISAVNSSLDIRGAVGGISGDDYGIYADESVTISGTVNGNITGGETGIRTRSLGVFINGTVNGDIIGRTGDGIFGQAGVFFLAESGRAGNITGGDCGIETDIAGVIINGTVGNITGEKVDGIMARKDVTISGRAGSITAKKRGIVAEVGSVTISGTVGNITAGGGIVVPMGDVAVSGTMGSITGSDLGIEATFGSLAVSGTITGEITGAGYYAIRAGSGITVTDHKLSVLDNGEEQGEIRQSTEYQPVFYTVCAAGKNTAAKRVRLTRPVAAMPLIPQVNVPAHRLPEYIEAEEVVEDVTPGEVMGDVPDVAEGTPDLTLG